MALLLQIHDFGWGKQTLNGKDCLTRARKKSFATFSRAAPWNTECDTTGSGRDEATPQPWAPENLDTRWIHLVSGNRQADSWLVYFQVQITDTQMTIVGSWENNFTSVPSTPNWWQKNPRGELTFVMEHTVKTPTEVPDRENVVAIEMLSGKMQHHWNVFVS